MKGEDMGLVGCGRLAGTRHCDALRETVSATLIVVSSREDVGAAVMRTREIALAQCWGRAGAWARGVVSASAWARYEGVRT